MKALLITSVLVATTAAFTGCSRRYLEPPVEYPYVQPAPMRDWRTDLTDTRAYYYVDQPIPDAPPPVETAPEEDVAEPETGTESTRGRVDMGISI